MTFAFSRTWTLAAVTAALAAGALDSMASVVYSNSVNDLTRIYRVSAGGPSEVGDEITLAGTDRNMRSFRFEYGGTNSATGGNFAGNVRVRLSLYNNDGLPFAGLYPRPGTPIWQSGYFQIQPINAYPFRATLTYSVANLDFNDHQVMLPDSFTWSVEFNGLTGGDQAWLDVYSPPTIPTSGGHPFDFWLNTGTPGVPNWELRQDIFGGTTNRMDFAADITAVPEPSVIWLAALGGLAGLSLARRWRKK